MAAFSNKPWNTISEVVAEGDKTTFIWKVGRVKTCRLFPTMVCFVLCVFLFGKFWHANSFFSKILKHKLFINTSSFGDSISSKPIAAGQSTWKVVYFPKGFTVRTQSQ